MTRHALAFMVVLLSVAACDDKPTEPTQTPPAAPKFTATLLAANEIPAANAADANAAGTATITFNVTRDAAGTVTSSGTVDFAVTLSGFPNGSSLTGAHIHPGASGATGSILISLALAAGEISFPAGTATITKNGIALTADNANAILANPANFYFNVHTGTSPGGAARGQLVRTQ